MFDHKGLIIEGDSINVINYIKKSMDDGGEEIRDISFIKDFHFVVLILLVWIIIS